MAAKGKAEHTFVAEIKCRAIDVETVVSNTLFQIGPVHIGETCEICFWKTDCIGTPILTNPYFEQETKWEVTGCISKIFLGAIEYTGTYESRLSSWKEACFGLEAVLSSVFRKSFQQKITPKQKDHPILTGDETKKFVAVFFQLVYKREEILDASLLLSVDENIDVSSISETFSGFQLNLRTSKNKAVRKLSENSEATVTPASSVGSSSPCGSPAKVVASASASGSSVETSIAIPSASRSPVKQSGSLSPSRSPSKSRASPSRTSPFKRFASPSRARNSPEAGSPSRTSPGKRDAEESECEFLINGVITVVQNVVNVSLYNLDKDLLKFLIGRFTCNRLKELKYLTHTEALRHCNEYKIQDPFKGAKRISHCMSLEKRKLAL